MLVSAENFAFVLNEWSIVTWKKLDPSLLSVLWWLVWILLWLSLLQVTNQPCAQIPVSRSIVKVLKHSVEGISHTKEALKYRQKLK